jgi:hypothetical protein
MGGQGSSRWGDRIPRDRTDEAMPLHVKEVVRVAPVSYGRCVTRRAATSRFGPFNIVIDATDDPITACVRYELAHLAVVPGEAFLWLLSTEPNFGGDRWWFLCPACGRRCSVVYFRRIGTFPWSCRSCLKLLYPSQTESRDARRARRLRKVLCRAGGAYKAISGMGFRAQRPRGMHGKTHVRLLNEADRMFFELASRKCGRTKLKSLWE